MTQIQQPPVKQGHPDRQQWCQYALHVAFRDLANRAVQAGWDEREVASTLVDLADHYTLSLVTSEEVKAILDALKKSS